MELNKTIFRQFRSFRSASILNISGLTVALAVFLVIVIQLHFEWGYDKSYPKSDRIFRVETLFPMSLQYSASSPAPLGEILKMNVPEVEAYFLLMNWGNPVAQINTGEEWGEKFSMECMVTSAAMIDMLDMEIIEGDGKQALSEPQNFMIPESFARKWFPGGSPIGRQIRIGKGQAYTYTVGAVYKDLPENSVFTNACYTSYKPSDDWGQWGGQLFVLSRNKGAAQLQEAISGVPIEPLKIIYEQLHKEEQRQKEGKSYLKVIPLPDVYYDDQAVYDTLAKGNKKHTYLMLGVGLLVIFIALVNFVNFTLSLAPARMRAVNTRKVLGASTVQLRGYFIAEALIYVGIAYLFALVLLQAIAGFGDDMLGTVSVEPGQHWQLIIGVGIGILIVGGLAGYYPAWYTTSFEPAMVLKGNFVHTPRGIAFRNGLSVFQFTISIVLIACAVLMMEQNRFMQKYTIGYQTENIGWVKLDMGFARNGNAIVEEVRQLPGVVDYTFSDFVPGGDFISGQGTVIEEEPVQFDVWRVYYNFLQFFGIRLLSGDSISMYNQNQPQLLVNEKAMKLFPVLERYQGKTIDGVSSMFADNLLIGVTNDVHYLSLHKPVGALAMVYYPSNSFSTMFFKLAPREQKAAIQQIRGIFDRLAPESMFEFHFLDDTLQQSYEHEHQLTAIISFLGGLAVFLALVGIYGMIVFQTQYRRKEIAIRKVNGATEPDIMVLLNRGMLYRWLAGVILAWPLAYYMMELWLRSFSYHTDIQVWMLILPGIVVLLILLLTVIWQSLKAARTNPVKELVKE